MIEADTDTLRTISLLLVDDHPVVRKGTRELLEGESDLRVIGEAGSGEEAVTQARALKPDVILMDVSMPGMNGIEATRAIKAEQPGVGVLVLTSYDDDAYVFALLEAGAAGYLLKNASEDDLLGAVRAVAAGEAILSPSATRALIDHFTGADSERRDAARSRISLLTRREQEVLVYLAQGMANARIARLMYLSEGAIKAHVSRLLTKLRCDNRVQAALIARDAALPC